MPVKETITSLIEEKDRLLNKLKTERPEVLTYLIENQIEIEDLAKYSASIAIALAISFNTVQARNSNQLPQLTPQVRIIEIDELRGKDNEQKAELVWKRYGHIIERVAKKYDLDPKLIFATIMIESGGNTYAIRHEPQINDASYGLGQILYGTAIGLDYEGNAEGLFDPEINIELIGRYHKRNLNVYGNLSLEQLTTAYNSGNPYGYALPGHLDKFNSWYSRVGDFMS